jgi:adhesin transport system outer membrane protein
MLLGIGNAQAETLQDAVYYVLQTNPEIRAVSFNRLAKDDEVKQARAGYLPSLDASHSFGLTEEFHPDGVSTWPSSTALSLRQNIFQGFATKYEIVRQKSRVNSAAYLLRGTIEDVALRASEAFLNVLRQQEIDDLSKENILIHRNMHDIIELKSESGFGRKSDLDQVKARLSKAESDTVVTQANVADAKTDYQFVVGRMPENLLKPDRVDSLMPVSLNEAEQLALANHPFLKSALLDVRAREAQHTVSKSNFYPKFDIAVDQQWKNDLDEPDYKEELNATAVVRFNLFNGWKDKARLSETYKLVCEAREIHDNTRRQIVESIRLSWVAYQSALSRIGFLGSYAKSLSTTAEAFKLQWETNRGTTLFDVLDINAELINAKIDLVNAIYDEVYAQYKILNRLGNLTHSMGLPWPEESKTIK